MWKTGAMSLVDAYHFTVYLKAPEPPPMPCLLNQEIRPACTKVQVHAGNVAKWESGVIGFS